MQLAYFATVAIALGILYIQTSTSNEVKQQLESTNQSLRQKDTKIQELEDKESKVNNELENKSKKLEETTTDLKELKQQKEETEEQVEDLKKQLQAKLEKQKAAKLAATTSQQVATTTTNNSSTSAPASSAPAPAATNTHTGSSGGRYEDGNNYPYGQCTWGADVLAGVPNALGSAGQWIYSLPSYGYRSTGPVPGAVAVFVPGVQGAGGLGHVAVVSKVNSDGSIVVGESNYNGVQAITYRTVSPSGIQFFSR